MTKDRITLWVSFATAADKARVMDKLYHYKVTMGRNATSAQAIEQALDRAQEYEQTRRNRLPVHSADRTPRWSEGPGAISGGAPTR